MAVLYGVEWPETLFVGQPCYYCGQPIAPPAVWWRGGEIGQYGGGDIVLHPACCLELVVRLVRDVHEIECRAGAGLVLARAPREEHGAAP